MRGLLALSILVSALSSVPAAAAPVTFQFSGHLEEIAALDPSSPFPDPVVFGTPFTGSYTFDGLATDGVPADPNTGSYASAGPPYAFNLSLAGLGFAFGAVDIGIANDYPGPLDQYLVTYAENPSGANITGVLLEITLQDFSGTAFSSDALPLVPPTLTDFVVRRFFFTDTIDGNQVEVAGVIDALAVAAVPEPSSLPLALVAMLTLATLARPRRRLR